MGPSKIYTGLNISSTWWSLDVKSPKAILRRTKYTKSRTLTSRTEDLDAMVFHPRGNITDTKSPLGTYSLTKEKQI